MCYIKKVLAMEKENKIKKRKQFNYIFQKGEACSSKTVTLVFTKSKNKTYKVGFSASKKVGNSVVRNRARRRMREAVRKNEELLNKNLCYIFVAKEAIDNADFLNIVQDVKFLINKANSII